MRIKMHNHGRSRKWVLLRILMIFLFVGVFSLALMLLWNWLMPEIFGLKSVSYTQAVGILVLSKLLFSGIGRGHHGPHHWHRRAEMRTDEPGAENIRE
jgi:ABC-type bacteriocin/lantibiotic exporter with double-glycine peptidase domain